MEVTPLEYRDVSVSSGEGARSDRRQASPIDNTTPTKATAKYEDVSATSKLPAPERYPIEVVARTLASNLLRIAPGLDPKMAQQIAMQLLTKPENHSDDAGVAAVASALGATVDFTA